MGLGESCFSEDMGTWVVYRTKEENQLEALKEIRRPMRVARPLTPRRSREPKTDIMHDSDHRRSGWLKVEYDKNARYGVLGMGRSSSYGPKTMR